MPRRFIRLLLVLAVMLSSEVWALGLGEVRLDSALNEPLRAEIELLGATPEELANLTVALASEETFQRYGIDRPFYLQDMVFDVVRSGQADGNYIRVRTAQPMTEPFLTFLVEASWSRGRLLREYTVLLDPPTYAPPAAAQSQPAVTAPQRSASSNSGQIDRQPPVQQPAPQPAPTRPAPAQTRPAPQAPASTPTPVADDTPFDTSAAGDYVVARGDTLWGIASRTRPDSRLSMNQTMLAIYEANPQAFQGNINILSAGASLNIPSADDIYRIDRGDANNEVQRQHASWGSYVPPPQVQPSEPADEPDTRPSLTLVPPDDEPIGVGTGEDTPYGEEPVDREIEIEDRIAAILAEDVPIEQSLIDIRNNELANLRQELADMRGEFYDPALDETLIDAVPDDEDLMVDDSLPDDELFPEFEETGEDAAAVDEPADTTPAEATPTQGSGSILDDTSSSLLDQILAFLQKGFWIIIGVVVVIVGGLLFWFMRRGREDDDDEGAWNPLDADEVRMDPLDSTESIQAPRHDESIVVVEQESGIRPMDDDTVEAPVPEPEIGENDTTGQFGSLEDTFSSDTAVNLDQSDPIAEADFHMAYGLYDQAADLINGALQVEPERQDLLTKLCEIYFVWGNRDAFIDAAKRLNSVTGGGDNEDWNKIVIMGQQIAADDALFAGAGVAGATKAVDLSFESEDGGTGALDMEFGADDGDDDVIDLGAEGDDDVIDLGAGDAADADNDDGVDFLFDSDATEVADTSDTTEETADFSVTSEMPTMEASTEDTVETPTIEEQFEGFDATSELPSIDESTLESAIDDTGQASDATAEINLDDLDLGIDDLAETELASLDDLDATGTNEMLGDPTEVTGKNPQVDPDATGVEKALNLDDELASTSEMRLANDETGQNPMMDAIDSDATDIGVDDSLLDATGHTQILSEDFAVETAAEEAGDLADNEATMMASSLDDDQETVLASLDDDDTDFDFAKTEALPPEVFTGNTSLDETGELPAVASTDVDLDLDDLTAALKVSEAGDTIEQARDDATVEQPRPQMQGEENSATMELDSDDMSEDLQEARTMTEVGTKLDLARAYVDMGDPAGARSILEEVLDEGDESQRQQAQQLLDSLPS